ncbi:hypothetical protein C8F01DRAFT_1079940 [Mycena amicta]|nr:hypothetical protein C8F01DRAFT_1079940 [Mycena amicta]
MPQPTLLALPAELLELIALHLATRPPNLGPPAALVALLCSCRLLHAGLAPEHNAPLYARIARAKFVLGPSTVRKYAAVLPSLCVTLRVIRSGDPYHPYASSALQMAYTLLIADDTKKPALGALSYALPASASATNDDEMVIGIGKNKRQLGWAGARAFALRWIRARMWENRYDLQNPDAAWRVGWPRDTNPSAAALWVLWFFESKETLAAEPDAFRQSIMTLLLPFVVTPFRYASALAPPHHYTVPLLPGVLSRVGAQSEGITVPTFHGDYPLYPLGKPGSGNPNTNPNRLLCAPPAILLFFARVQAGGRMGIPPHLALDRADLERRWAAAGNQGGPPPVGPTQADLVEKNTRPVVRFERQVVSKGVERMEDKWAVDPADAIHDEDEDEWKQADGRWEPDRWRARMCRGYEEEEADSDDGETTRPTTTTTPNAWQGRGGSPPGRIGRVYQLGSFAGLWAGTMMMPAEQPYTALIDTPGGALPARGLVRGDFVAAARPVYMRIREHWSFHPETPAPPAPANSTTGDEGMRNGWFPAGTQLQVGEPSRGGKLRVSVPGRAEVYEYETVLGSDGVGCPGCVVRAERERRRRRRRREREREGSDDGSGEPTSRVSSPWPEWTRLNPTPDPDASDVSDLDPDVSDASDDDPDDDADDQYADDDEYGDWDWESWESTGMCDGVQDVVFTGETDPHHGQAWHHYDFSGRVRPWDGLIGFVMRPRNRTIGLATYFICGHVVGQDTFQGTWRMAAQDVLAPSWGGSLCLARGEE